MPIFTFLGIGTFAQTIKQANTYFRSGCFIEAKNEYAQILEMQPKNLESLIYQGYISLMQNKLEEAENWLLKASEIKSNDNNVNEFLAETYYRKNDFQKAAPYFRAIGREGMALKLESFRGTAPYQTDKLFDEVHIKFIVTDPLPFIRVTINGAFEGNFMLDTGGGELILDEAFAGETGAEIFENPENSHFGGGKKKDISHGKISSIQFNNLKIKNIPINILSLRHIELAGMKIDGIMGTIFLSQFLSSIDYKYEELVLRNKLNHTLAKLSEKAVNSSCVPFFLAGDHFMLAKGSINDSGTLLFFIDTGLASTAFTCPGSTTKKMKLPIQKNKKTTGQGGGGEYDIYPFDIEKLCLGNVCVSNLHGNLGPFPAAIEHSFGFKIDGLLSHEFFLGKTLTMDFDRMVLLISE